MIDTYGRGVHVEGTLGYMWRKHRGTCGGNIGEHWGTCGGNIGEHWGTCGGNIGEHWGTCGGNIGLYVEGTLGYMWREHWGTCGGNIGVHVEGTLGYTYLCLNSESYVLFIHACTRGHKGVHFPQHEKLCTQCSLNTPPPKLKTFACVGKLHVHVVH